MAEIPTTGWRPDEPSEPRAAPPNQGSSVMSADRKAPVHGDIEVTENRHRRQAFVRVGKIAAVVEVCEGGPSTLIFTSGGEMEICGGAQYWRRRIAIAELECK